MLQVPYYRELQPSSTVLDDTISKPNISAVFSGAALEKTADILAHTTEAISNITISSSMPSMEKVDSTITPSVTKIIADVDSSDSKEADTKNNEKETTMREIKLHTEKEEGSKANNERNPDYDDSSIAMDAKTAGYIVLSNENGDKLQMLMQRQYSANDSLTSCPQYTSIPHMITTNTETGKLPLFSSWALTQLGSSSVYAHSSGVNQVGFISNTRNLLPWDVPLKNTDWHTLQRKWPNIAESAIKKSSFNPAGKGADMGLTVKVFIGLEYECPRGHRVIASSPGKTKSMTSSITNRMVNSDSPLYMECQCSKGTSHPVVSQLMRIHIVTPKAPMHITLNPRVIPCPDGPTFLPGWNSSTPASQKTMDDKSSISSSNQIKLPISSYWVLRLPFIYWGKFLWQSPIV